MRLGPRLRLSRVTTTMHRTATLLLFALLLAPLAALHAIEPRNTMPDTWSATDALRSAGSHHASFVQSEA